MKVSVIISMCDNRYEHFKRSLDSWCNQTMPKKDYELIIVDDANRKDIKDLCKEYSKKGLCFQYVRIDNAKSYFPIKTFIPVLSNNVGFRLANGEVVVITGPETLQSERNLDIAYKYKDLKKCAYGLVYRSNIDFVSRIKTNWNEPIIFNELLKIPGAKADCRTVRPHPPAYYYFMAVSKKYVEEIHGLDEKFAQGVCAEDDDFSNRMAMNNVEPVFEHKIIGIHQDHSIEDANSPAHAFRKTPDGIKARQNNIALMKSNITNAVKVANVLDPHGPNYDPEYCWGDPRVIVEKEVF